MSCFTFPHKSMVRQPFCLLPHMDKFIVRTKVTKPPRPLPLLASGALPLRKNFDSLVPIPKVHPKFLPKKTSSPKYSETIAAFCHFKRKVGEHENLRSWQMEFQLMWNEGKADLPALLQQFEKSARENLDTQASDGDETMYEPERIIKSVKRRGKVHYQVRCHLFCREMEEHFSIFLHPNGVSAWALQKEAQKLF